MKATVLDLRRNMKGVMAALRRNEKVTLTYRGERAGVIMPCTDRTDRMPVDKHPAFGMWTDRDDFADVAAVARDLRRGRQF